MIPTSVHERVPLQPKGEEGPTYWMRPLRLRDRSQITSMMVRAGYVGVVSHSAIREELMGLLPQIASSQDYDKLMGALTALNMGELVDAEDLRAINAVQKTACKRFPHYAELLAEQLEWNDEYTRLLVKVALVGIEGGVEWQAGADGYTADAVLDAISMRDHMDYQFLAAHVDQLGMLRESDQKNSELGSSSSCDQPTLHAADVPQTAPPGT